MSYKENIVLFYFIKKDPNQKLRIFYASMHLKDEKIGIGEQVSSYLDAFLKFKNENI